MKKTAEQQARDLLEACFVEDAQSYTSGELVFLANYIADAEAWRAHCRECDGWSGRV